MGRFVGQCHQRFVAGIQNELKFFVCLYHSFVTEQITYFSRMFKYLSSWSKRKRQNQIWNFKIFNSRVVIIQQTEHDIQRYRREKVNNKSLILKYNMKKVQWIYRSRHFSEIYFFSALYSLNTKRRLLYLKTQFVPRSKHFSSRL